MVTVSFIQTAAITGKQMYIYNCISCEAGWGKEHTSPSQFEVTSVKEWLNGAR